MSGKEVCSSKPTQTTCRSWLFASTYCIQLLVTHVTKAHQTFQNYIVHNETGNSAAGQWLQCRPDASASAFAQPRRPGTATTQLQDVRSQCHSAFLTSRETLKVYHCLVMHQPRSTIGCYNALLDSRESGGCCGSKNWVTMGAAC